MRRRNVVSIFDYETRHPPAKPSGDAVVLDFPPERIVRYVLPTIELLPKPQLDESA